MRKKHATCKIIYTNYPEQAILCIKYIKSEKSSPFLNCIYKNMNPNENPQSSGYGPPDNIQDACDKFQVIEYCV